MDVGASLSGSSSATSGLTQSFDNIFGDHNAGGGPSWVMPAIIGAIALVIIIWLIRR